MKFNQKGFAAVIVALIVAVMALGGVGIYLYQTQITKPKPVPVAQKTETPANPPADSEKEAKIEVKEQEKLESEILTEAKPAMIAAGQTESINTSYWKTYRNEKCGFEIKYPAGYFTKESNNGIFFSSGVDCKDNSFCDEIEGSVSPSVYCYAAAEMLQESTIENYLSDPSRAAKDFPIKKIVSNGNYGYEIEALGMAGGYKSVYFLKGDNLVNFSVAKEGNEKGVAFLDQIVSTFKFVD